MLPKDDTKKPAQRDFPPSLTNQAWLKWSIFDFNHQVETFKAEVAASKRRGGFIPSGVAVDVCVPDPLTFVPHFKPSKS